MTVLEGLSDSHAALLAVQLCLNGDVSGLPLLKSQFPHTLHLELLFRIILTFLPEITEPEQYIQVIKQLVDDSSAPDRNLDTDVAAIREISEPDARKQVRHLKLLPLRRPHLNIDVSEPPLIQFLIHRAHRIDTEVGLQLYILELVDPFISDSTTLRDWTISVVLPAIRFNYEYHPDNEGALSLELVESLDSRSAVNILLSAVEPHAKGGDVGRDLKGLVGPWMYGHVKSKRRKLDKTDPNSSTDSVEVGWQDVNEWILSTSIRDFHLAIEAVEQWSGPGDINLGDYDGAQDGDLSEDMGRRLMFRYAQAGLASIYALSDGGFGLISGASRILSRVADFTKFDDQLHINSAGIHPLSLHIPELEKVSRQHLLHNMLLNPSNPLTYPTKESISFTDAILVSIRILDQYGRWMSPRAAAELMLLGQADAQFYELRKLLETLNHQHPPPKDWNQVRESLLWLHSWGGSTQPEVPQGLFWKIPLLKLEREIFIAILTAREYNLAADVYLSSSSSTPLPREEIESAVTETIFAAYDNATNGNKTRGGMKRAADLLEAFTPYFPQSVPFQQISSLLSATHALSFYSLTLQHGVPFQPVSIRVHQDPISLIEKVLEQNPKGYTQLDDLLAIGRNLVAAGLPTGMVGTSSDSSPSKAVVSAERRIMSLAIAAAVNASDFDTAYSYVVTRVIPPSLVPGSERGERGHAQGEGEGEDDDISWRSAYNTGRHPPTGKEAQETTTLVSRIARLSQRMELLSLALVLAPAAEYLPEILAVWRRCEEEMSSLQEQEMQEAESWDYQGDRQGRMGMGGGAALPGGFGPSSSELDALDTELERERRARSTRQPQPQRQAQRPGKLSGYEEAPMGLFDVARGAASALRKNAFPLTSATPANSSRSMTNSSGEEGQGAETPRTRKRDVVSNLVTEGLVSGIGWVIGAPAPAPASASGRGSPE
ncbi:hypothetical protein MGYG_01033 [Nannizzia gypsea CBS 118893]|uniref:Sec39 domain-containing protein n=1 Tax=Arthroderma gypseum (strain ATCC MYA-4604 / CBS 118893) TaxID=535722 RepID=E5R3T7_ARTGP|nr:hypothetical protein MGYG_01033 [Nannizzia gypsea CBS 118893]EFQ97997.1 hypothetical protein MGYG_01033 [Nannizzia gypsea CBS 118893]